MSGHFTLSLKSLTIITLLSCCYVLWEAEACVWIPETYFLQKVTSGFESTQLIPPAHSHITSCHYSLLWVFSSFPWSSSHKALLYVADIIHSVNWSLQGRRGKDLELGMLSLVLSFQHPSVQALLSSAPSTLLLPFLYFLSISPPNSS